MKFNTEKISEIMSRKNVTSFALRAMLVLLPFLCVFIISLCFGYKGSFKILFPVWNDEIGWYSQIDSIIHYGSPLGYWGYNEGHAQMGTFGPWGVAPLLPYALFGKIFGWNLNSMAIANVLFLSVSLLLFILLTKPTNRQVVCLMIAYVSLYIVIGYSLTSMSESLRYSCAIVLTGFIIWLERCTRAESPKMTRAKIILFALCCVYTLYCVQVYLIFSLVVFIIALLALRKTKMNLLLRFISSALITIAVAAISYKLVVMVSCSYFQPSTIQTIFDHIKTDGLYKGICFTLNNFFNNLGTVNFPELMNLTDTYRGILIWYFLSYIGLLFFMLKRFIQNKRSTKSSENVLFNTALFFLLGFIAAYCLLYTGSKWTLCRGTNTGFIMTVFLLIFTDKKKYVHNYALVTLFAVVSVWTYYGTLINERNSTAQYEQQIYSEKEKLSEIIDISPEYDPWENTVAAYNIGNIWLLSFPSGTGFNGIFNGQVCERSKYAVMPAANATDEQKAAFASKGYDLLYTDDIFAIFIRNDQ